MRRLFAHVTEIAGRGDDAFAEMVVPQPVHQHPRSERVVAGDDPAGKSQTPLLLGSIAGQGIRFGDFGKSLILAGTTCSPFRPASPPSKTCCGPAGCSKRPTRSDGKLGSSAICWSNSASCLSSSSTFLLSPGDFSIADFSSSSCFFRCFQFGQLLLTSSQFAVRGDEAVVVINARERGI